MKPGTDNITPPVKGEVRNPKGKPKGTLNRRTKLKMWADIVEKVTNPITGQVSDLDQVDQAMLTLIGIAKNPNDPRAVKAIQELLDTLYGKNADVLIDQSGPKKMVMVVTNGDIDEPPPTE